MTRFKIATNPMFNEPPTIIHMRRPVMHFEVGSMRCLFSETSDNNEIDMIRNRAEKWYKSYLIFEDEKFNR